VEFNPPRFIAGVGWFTPGRYPTRPAPTGYDYSLRRATADEVKKTKPAPVPINALVAGSGARLALAYGHVMLPVLVTAFGVNAQDKPILQGTICKGEVSQVLDLYESNQAMSGAKYTAYVGNQTQGADSRLAGAIAGYTDDLLGVCYCSIQADITGGVKSYQAEVEGRLCFDPRDSGTAYTTNPALHFRDAAVLAGLSPDDDSIEATADACDALLDGLPRRTCSVFFNRPISIDQVLRTLAEYAGAFYLREAGVVKLVPDRPVAVAVRFTDDPADGTRVQVKERTLKLRKVSLGNSPNRVITEWTDTTAVPWRTRYAATPVPGGEENRTTTFSMLGYHSFREANRHSIERLNAFLVADLLCEFEAFDDSLELELGDVFSLTCGEGLTDKEFRAERIEQGDDVGHWKFWGKEYNSAQYSDDIQDGPPLPDADGIDPASIPAGPTPTAVEKLYVEEGGRTLSRLEINFSGISWPFVKAYRVEVLEGAVPIHSETVMHLGDGATHTTVSPPVAQDVEYTVNVYTVNVFLTVGTTAGTTTVTGLGKLLKPLAPGAITQGYEVGLMVFLRWGDAADIDLAGYRVKRITKTDYDSDPGTAWDNANAITVASRHDATSILLPAQPIGTYVYMVKSLDSVGADGQESVAWVEKQIEVTPDAAGAVSVGTVDVDPAQNTNVHQFTLPGGDAAGGKYICSTDGKTWEQRFGTAGVDTWETKATAGDHWHQDMTLASSMESLTWDTGEDRQGNWVWALTVVPLGSPTMVYTSRLATAAAYPTFTDFAGQSANVEARYLRCKIANTAVTAGAGFCARMVIDTSYQGVILYDEQTVNITAASMPYAHTWNEPFAAAPKVTLTVLNGDARLVARDNTTKDGCDIECWQISGGAPVYADTTLEIVARGT
jgi:hypothetical protein